LARIVTAEDLRAKLGRELDALRESDDVLYVSKRGRLAAAVMDAERYAELIERIDYLEDSLAALEARADPESSVAWTEVRE
jgi:prevent-host-death family protein